MKKYFLLGLAILFMSAPVQAMSAVVHYNECGRPNYVTYGNGVRQSIPLGTQSYGGYRNYIAPRTYARPHQRNYARPHGYYNNYYPTPVTTITTTNPAPVSRLNRNYVRPQRSSYRVNGVTYYN